MVRRERPLKLQLSVTTCSECEGLGYVVQNVRGRVLAHVCQCVLEKRALAAVPPNYRDALMNDFSDAHIEAIAEWRMSAGEGLVICGLPGRGKTYLACAITKGFVECGWPTVFLRAYDLFAELRQANTAGGK